MKAAFIRDKGLAEAIEYGEVDKPVASGTQVLVKVKAVSVNPIDTYVRAGMVDFNLPLPFIVGCDLAGVVEETGPGAKMFKRGDRVWGSNQGLLGRQGTFAEYAAVEEKWLYPTPDNVGDEEAAASALVGITAHLGLVNEARIREGKTIFVVGGSGGVGSMVIQISKILGARVIACAGNDEKLRVCRDLGADEVVNYKTQKIEPAIRGFAPEGVDYWWETRRDPDFDQVVSALAPRGRMILMAGRDARPPFPVGPFYVKNCSVHGFVMFMATAEEQRVCASDLNEWMSAGKLKPRIHKVLPLSEASAAHKLQEENTIGGAGTLCGKIVLKP